MTILKIRERRGVPVISDFSEVIPQDARHHPDLASQLNAPDQPLRFVEPPLFDKHLRLRDASNRV
jgi:hypothetical protein